MLVGGGHLGLMDAANTPASVTYVGTAAYVNNSSTITYTNAAIGAASDNRHVIYFVHTGVNAGGYQPSSYTCTIGGITATKLLERITNYGSGAVFIAKVPTGTTATCIADGNAGGLFYPTGAVFYTNNLRSATPTDTDIVSNTTAAKTGTIDVQAGGIIVAHVGGWTNVASTVAWTGTAGVTEVSDSNPDGLNDMRLSGATLASSSALTGVTTIATSSTGYIASSIADLMVLAFR